MKKKLQLGIIIALLAFSACNAENAAIDSEMTESDTSASAEITDNSEVIEDTEVKYALRNVNWGMSIQDVIASEEQDYTYFYEDSNSLLYNNVTAGNVTFSSLMYAFDTNDALYRATYMAKDTHTSDNLYVEDYNSLNTKLTSLYGEPNDIKEIWHDDLYKGKTDKYGIAVAKGDLTLSSRWITDTTEIGLLLIGDNYECSLAIIYTDINYQSNSNGTDGL